MKNVTNQNEITSRRIKELREEGGLTQEELAKNLIISREALANFETRRDIPEDILKDIAKHLNTTVDYLLGKTNVKSKDYEDYKFIGERTGLNDKAIKILGDLFKYSPNIIDTINYLIEQEEFLPVTEFYATDENTKEAEKNFEKMNYYWDEIHFPVLSKITNYYNVEMPKEALYITKDGIKKKEDFKNKLEMIRKTKAKISSKNLVDNGLIEEIEYQLKKSKENKNDKTKQKEQNKQMKKYIEKYNEYGK